MAFASDRDASNRDFSPALVGAKVALSAAPGSLMRRFEIVIRKTAEKQERLDVPGRFASLVITVLLMVVAIALVVAGLVLGYLLLGVVLAALLIAFLVAMIRGIFFKIRR